MMPSEDPPPAPALPLSEFPAEQARQVCGVLTDIDDTLTANGEIAPAALDALTSLRAAGLPVLAITGRPMGWSEPFARTWPLDAIVAENGAVALFKDANGGLAVEFAQDATTRAQHRRRLDQVAERVLREVPGSTLAQDSAGRVTDIAIDHSEFVQMSTHQIDHVVAIMRAEGMTATVSSIHINGWFGDHTKLSGARWIVGRVLGRSLDTERDQWVYVGDSTNDQLMFGHFPLSVGVANVRHFADQLHTWPRYITRRERGEGFAELVRHVLAAR